MDAIRFKYDVPLVDTMAFESEYHENLKYDSDEKRELRDVIGSLFVWMFVGKDLVGEAYGFPLANCDKPIAGLTEITALERKLGIYCYSNTILASFQRKGFGRILKAHWLGMAAGRGFAIVYGHARSGGSQALNAEFNATFLESFPNWYDTEEEYKLYRLELDRAR